MPQQDEDPRDLPVISRRGALKAIAPLLASGIALPTRAQSLSFPDHPITCLVPFPAGGVVDGVAREVARGAGPRLGQQVVVESRPGAATLLATRALLARPADGYTLLVQTPSLVTLPMTEANPGYRIDDLIALASLGVAASCLVVSRSAPASLAEFIRHWRSRPGQLNVATPGEGGTTGLLTRRFLVAAGLSGTMIPYKGSTDAMQDVIGGRADLFLLPVAVAAPLQRAGTLRVLAVADERRSSVMPDVPTFAEQGLPDISGPSWMVVFAAARTPAPVVRRLSDALLATTREAGYAEALRKFGVEPPSVEPADLADYVRRDSQRWQKDVDRLKSTGRS